MRVEMLKYVAAMCCIIGCSWTGAVASTNLLCLPTDSDGGSLDFRVQKNDGHYTIPIDEHRDYEVVVATLQRLADAYGTRQENTFIVSRVFRVWGTDSLDVYWKEDGSLLELRLPVRADQETSSRIYTDRIKFDSADSDDNLCDTVPTRAASANSVRAVLEECERHGKMIVLKRSLIPPGRPN